MLPAKASIWRGSFEGGEAVELDGSEAQAEAQRRLRRVDEELASKGVVANQSSECRFERVLTHRRDPNARRTPRRVIIWRP